MTENNTYITGLNLDAYDWLKYTNLQIHPVEPTRFLLKNSDGGVLFDNSCNRLNNFLRIHNPTPDAKP